MAIQGGSTVVTLLRKDKKLLLHHARVLTSPAARYTQNPLHETLADNGGNQGTCYDFSAPLL